MRQRTLIEVRDVAHNLHCQTPVRIEFGDLINLRKGGLHAVSLHSTEQNLSPVSIALGDLELVQIETEAYESVQKCLPFGLSDKTERNIEGSRGLITAHLQKSAC